MLFSPNIEVIQECLEKIVDKIKVYTLEYGNHRSYEELCYRLTRQHRNLMWVRMEIM